MKSIDQDWIQIQFLLLNIINKRIISWEEMRHDDKHEERLAIACTCVEHVGVWEKTQCSTFLPPFHLHCALLSLHFPIHFPCQGFIWLSHFLLDPTLQIKEP